MRTSKYLNKMFGNWKCTYVGIANVQGARSARPGHLNYYYIFERTTSDGLCDKMIRLNSSEASLVYKGVKLVEEIAVERKKESPTEFTRKLSYHFV